MEPELRDEEGKLAGITVPLESDGSYSFESVAQRDYQVVVVPPSGYEVKGRSELLADTTLPH